MSAHSVHPEYNYAASAISEHRIYSQIRILLITCIKEKQIADAVPVVIFFYMQCDRVPKPNIYMMAIKSKIVVVISMETLSSA